MKNKDSFYPIFFISRAVAWDSSLEYFVLHLGFSSLVQLYYSYFGRKLDSFSILGEYPQLMYHWLISVGF
jgi:hypothetical protein